MTVAGIVLMCNLRWFSIVLAAWLSIRNVATAFPDVERRLTSPRIGTLKDPGLKIVATGTISNASRSGHSSLLQLPIVRGRRKQSLRGDVPLLSVGDRALPIRLTRANRDLSRFESSFSEVCAVGICVFLCRFSL